MSIKDNFDDDQWFLLSSTPALIGAAMSTAASSGVIGTVKELSASMRSVVQGKSTYADSELITTLLHKAENWDAAKEKMESYRERTKSRMESAGIKSREDLIATVEADCRAAAALVDEHCSPDEATAYKSWSVSVARAVAEAAKEGSFLGVGGVRVSPEEEQLLVRIENALGAPTGHLLA